MKTKLFLITLFAIFQSIYAQDISGSWKGDLEVQGTRLPLIFNIHKDGNGYKSVFDSPMQGAKAISIQKTDFQNNEITFDASNLGITYKGKLKGNKIEGNFFQNGMILPLNLERKTNAEPLMNRPQTPKPPFDYDTEEVNFNNETEGNKLAGTLTTSKSFSKNSPIVVMITGSGPQNRDEELFGHKPFLVIADNFAKKGIATLRLDDRGIGNSEKGKAGPTTADFAGDISSAVNFLAKRGYKNVGLLGHSEGGMIAPMVAAKNKKVKFLVLMAAPGTPIDELLVQQNYNGGKLVGMSEKDLQNAKTSNQTIYKFIRDYNGNNYENDVKKFLNENFKDKMGETEINAVGKQTKSNWFRYFIKFTPDLYLSQIKIPVLALNGSLDFQVPAKENLVAIKKSLTKANNKNFETLEIEGKNHLFQTAKTGSFSEYGQIEETISPKVLDKMSAWILNLK